MSTGGWNQSGSIPKTTSVGQTFIGLIKFKFTSATAVTVLRGAEFVNTISVTTNTNAAVATVTLNCGCWDVVDVGADFRDDGQAGFWTSVGNITGEGSANSNAATAYKIAFFNAGGSMVTTSNLNANSAVCSTYVFFQTQNLDKGT